MTGRETSARDTGDIYAGVDRFGRVQDLRWRNVTGNTDLSRIKYGYDRASNRTWRTNPTDAGSHHDWLYAYDGLQRLNDAERGTLAGGQTTIDDPQFPGCPRRTMNRYDWGGPDAALSVWVYKRDVFSVL